MGLIYDENTLVPVNQQIYDKANNRYLDESNQEVYLEQKNTKSRTPFSHQEKKTTAGAVTNSYIATQDIILTGIYFNITGNAELHLLPPHATIESSQATGLTFIFIPIPEWIIKKDENIDTYMSCAAGARIDVTYIGYYLIEK